MKLHKYKAGRSSDESLTVMTEHPEARLYWAVMDGYLKRIGTVKYSHSWPARGSAPGNPQEGAYVKKSVIFVSSWVFHHLCCRAGWWCLSPVCCVCASLGWRLPNHLDAVLLELSSKQSILILQLFDLRNKEGQELINIFIPATVTYSSELTEQTFSVPGIKEWYVQPCVKTPCPQPTGLSNLVVCHLCYISPEWILNSLPPSPTEGDFAYVNNNILLSALRALDSMGRNGSLGALRLHSTSECISMQLALTQPWCILFPQSL